MNLSKSLDFFNPGLVSEDVHIIGCGSVGSHEAVLLAKAGIGTNGKANIVLWDMDIVEEKNVANQAYTSLDVGKPKVEALRDILLAINPDLENNIVLKPDGWQGEILSGYVFLAVDNIEIRKDIVDKNMSNVYVKGMFDIRTGLTDGQHFAADWSDYKAKQNFLRSMNFSHDEAEADVPRSACGGILGVASTVWIASSIAVNNFIRFVKGDGYAPAVAPFDGFEFYMNAAPIKK